MIYAWQADILEGADRVPIPDHFGRAPGEAGTRTGLVAVHLGPARTLFTALRLSDITKLTEEHVTSPVLSKQYCSI